MRVKYHYPVKSNFPIPEKWPVNVEKYCVELSEENGRVNSIAVSVALDGTERLPAHVPPNNPKIDFAIDVGDTASNEGVEQFLITVQGLLGLFGKFSIDFSSCKTEWMAENEEEKSKIEINNYSLKIGKPQVNEPVPLPFEVIARAIFAAPDLFDYQVPLSFIRRGVEDMTQDRHIEAFYNFFFFLETLFAPGYSDPKRVKEKFLKAKPIRDAIAHARQDGASHAHFKAKELKALLSKTDEEIVDHLVKTRGNLHHHNRHAVRWHPEKSGQHEAEALLIQSIAVTIALNEAVTRIHDPSHNEKFIQSIKDVGATQVIRVDALEVVDGQQRQVPSVNFDCPGQKPNHRLLGGLHQEVRDMIGRERKTRKFSRYRLSSADGKQIYATYQCHLLADASRAVVRQRDDKGT